MKLIVKTNRSIPVEISATKAIAEFFADTNLSDSAMLWANCVESFFEQNDMARVKKYADFAIEKALEAGAVLEYR